DTDVSIPVLLPAGGGSVRLHRSEFESMIRPQVEETVDALRTAVRSAGCLPGELSAVLLVGGSSRIPLVAQLVSEGLARPVAVDADPKNAIAKGAALSVSPMPTASWPVRRVGVATGRPRASRAPPGPVPPGPGWLLGPVQPMAGRPQAPGARAAWQGASLQARAGGSATPQPPQVRGAGAPRGRRVRRAPGTGEPPSPRVPGWPAPSWRRSRRAPGWLRARRPSQQAATSHPTGIRVAASRASPGSPPAPPC